MKPTIMNSMKTSLLAVMGALLVTGFQNCSPVEFADQGSGPANKSGTEDILIELPEDPDLVDNELPEPLPGPSPEPTPELPPGPTPEPELPPGPSPIPPDMGSTPTPNPGKNKAALCFKLQSADVIVNVASIGFASSSVKLAGPGSISLYDLSDTGIEVEVPEQVLTNQVRLVLATTGNAIVSGEESYPLKTPSGQQSGLKLQTRGARTFEANRKYIVRAQFDPTRQIVYAGKSGKCLLKPVFHVTEVK